MSNNTERKEEDKEGLKRELCDMGMYESGYSYEEMKQILKVVRESKDMANMANRNASSRPTDTQEKEDSAGKSNLSRDTEEDRTDSSKTVGYRTDQEEASRDTEGGSSGYDTLERTGAERPPLRQPERRKVEEREPFKWCKEVRNTETLEQVLVALNRHLRCMAELWYRCNRTANTKLQWGSPIQVGTPNDSLDRNPVDDKPETQERTSKRKLKSNEVHESLSSSSSSPEEEAEEDASFLVKRKKIQRKESLSDEKPEDILLKRTTEEERVTIELEDDTTIEDTSQEHRYPRRIVPPIPKKFSGPRKKKSNTAVKSTKPSSSQKSTDINSTSSNMAGKGGEEEEEEEEEKKSLEIKPLVLKNLSVRLERACALLKSARAEKQRQVEAEREEVRKKEEEERRRKEENARRHMEEVQLRHRQREEAQKWVKERSTKWNNVLEAKSKESKERSKSLREQEEARLAELEEENRLLQDSDMEGEEETVINVNCPICNKPFPNDLIETHAASCEQYNTEDQGTSNSSHRQPKMVAKRKTSKQSEILECNICSTFRTTNGIEYEDHVNSCIQRQSASQDSTTLSIQDIPTSPIRCFKPISEQTDSEIDYKAQFGTNSKAVRPNRKRKR